MSQTNHFRLFQKAAGGIFLLFMGIMVFVTVFSFTRPSGSTRQDMAQAEFIRQKSIAYQPAE